MSADKNQLSLTAGQRARCYWVVSPNVKNDEGLRFILSGPSPRKLKRRCGNLLGGRNHSGQMIQPESQRTLTDGIPASEAVVKRLVGCFLIAIGLSNSLALTAWGQAWHIPSASARLRIERIPGTPWPAEVGTVEVWPADPVALNLSLFTAAGQSVNARTYWQAGHEPIKLQFETASGETVYYLYFNPDAMLPPGSWQPQAGLILETRTIGNLPANSWAQAQRVLNAATLIAGRSYVPNIFQGVNPHGPGTYYAALFNGYFTASPAGEYAFATVSDGASFLQVDGRMVAEWPGKHRAGAGLLGQHNGKIQLAAGRHRMEYVQIQYDGPSAAVAAWKPPGQARFEVMPPSVFAPVARFRATAFEPVPGSPSPVYVEWHDVGHSMMQELAWVTVQFRVVENQSAWPWTYRWSFDDGFTGIGATLEHVFPRTGLRQVNLEALANGNRVATRAISFKVHPNWSQLEEWRAGVFEPQKKELLSRDLTGTPRMDLIAIMQGAERFEDRDLLRHAGLVFLRRQEEFNATHAELFYTLGLNFRPQSEREADVPELAFRAALVRSAGHIPLKAKVQLRLAEFLIHSSERPPEALALLNSVSTAGLSVEEKRLRTLLEGDAALAQGKVEVARKIFQAAGERPDPVATNGPVRRWARLAGANDLIRRGEWDAAERLVQANLGDYPLERLSLQTGLLLVNVYLGRQQYHYARAACHRLLWVATENPAKPDLLLALGEANRALGRAAEASDALGQLARDYPESEAAARAKGRVLRR